MTEAQSAVTDRATYGNFIAQRSPGLLGAGLIGTGVLFGGIVCALLALLAAGIEAALIVAGLGVLTFTITGTPVGAWAARRIGYARARFAGDTMHRSGTVARDSSGVWRPAKGDKPVVHTTRLPGMLAQTAVLESVDGFGRRFAVVRSTGGLYSITARCSAEGPSMQDQEQVDRWVAGWSTVLSSAGQESGLQCLKAITASEPDPGGRLPAMVSNLRASSSPELADAVMAECVATLPATSSEVSTYVELTYRGRFLSRRGDQAAILAELARKVPGLVAMLQTAGGGSVEMVTPGDLAALVRAAYDPAAAGSLEQAELDGLPGPTWDEAGPVAYHETWSDLTHDSGRSVTWEMQQPPRSSITENALAGLLKPHPDFARKRVALIYRPHTPDESTRVAERDSTTANFVAQQGKKRPSAAAQRVQRAAEQSRQEVAAGAAAVRFSLLVTVTVRPDQDALQAVSTLEASGRGVPIRLRRVYGSQAAGFAATLPVGFVPHLHTVVPSTVREWL